MIDNKTVLAVITARGGSKGIPRKNIRDLGGKPLIAWTITEAKRSAYIDRVIVSSEDAEIMDIARFWGGDVPFARPPELAQDETPGIDPVLHALKMVPGFDYVVLLQPTSPLRRTRDIDGSIERCIKLNAPACVTVTESKKSPHWMYNINSEWKMRPLLTGNDTMTCRQELPTTFLLNGAVYVAQVKWLMENKNFFGTETVAYPMPTERSVDIDAEIDFLFAELLIREGYYE